jgi:hypothetical protein
MKRIPTLVMTLLGAFVALAAAVAYWAGSPFASVSRLVLADVVVVALAIVAVVVAARTGRWKAPSWALWIACGALLGAAAAGPVKLALWLFPASLAIGAARPRTSASIRFSPTCRCTTSGFFTCKVVTRN